MNVADEIRRRLEALRPAHFELIDESARSAQGGLFVGGPGEDDRGPIVPLGNRNVVAVTGIKIGERLASAGTSFLADGQRVALLVPDLES